MPEIIYRGQRYVLHTAAETYAPPAPPANWETNKQEYITKVIADLEALGERVYTLGIESDVIAEQPGDVDAEVTQTKVKQVRHELKLQEAAGNAEAVAALKAQLDALGIKKSTTGLALDNLAKVIDNTIAAVELGEYLIKNPTVPAKRAVKIPITEVVPELTRIVDQWEKFALSSRPASDVPDQQRKKEEVLGFPKFVKVQLDFINKHIVEATELVNRAAVTEGQDPEESARIQAAQAALPSFMYRLKVVNESIAKGKYVISNRVDLLAEMEDARKAAETAGDAAQAEELQKRIDWVQGTQTTDKDLKDRYIKDIVKELFTEFKAHWLVAKAQKAKEKAEADAKAKADKPEKEKKPKEPKPDNLMEVVKELLATLEDIKNKQPMFLQTAKAREGFDKLVQDTIAVGKAVDAGAASVTLSSGEYPIKEAVKLVQDGMRQYRSMMKREFEPGARAQEKQVGMGKSLEDLDKKIAEIDQAISAVRSQQSRASAGSLELLEQIKRKPDRASKLPLMARRDKIEHEVAELTKQIDTLRKERSSVSLARDNLLKSVRPGPQATPEVTKPTGPIYQTPEF
ncbi:MAG: hypothetical protein WC505_06980 [Patescibacteria group bacterium]